MRILGVVDEVDKGCRAGCVRVRARVVRRRQVARAADDMPEDAYAMESLRQGGSGAR